MRAALLYLITALAVLPAPLAAQTAVDPPRLLLSAGAGIVNPLHGDLDFRAPLFSAAFEFPISRHLGLEAEFQQWKHTDTDERIGLLIRDPTGVIGRAGRLTTREALTARSLGFKAIARAGSAARVFGGGGLGIFWHDRLFEQILEDCDVPSQPSACAPVRNVRTAGPDAGLQGIAGLEVAVTRRWIVFGAFRVDLRTFEDVASTTLGGIGGVRFGIR